ncbi:hypothetical protein ACF1G5_13100 [Streptomyces coeruleorubidus]|uniref:hypothetical protein n=1 Tax=Streptomyces coeruleorubidus TaxID=116188 RepID=UPI0036FDE705
MSHHRVYGTSAHTASDLVELVTACLGMAFAERESDYRGVYHVADGGGVRIEIQPNKIPWDCGEEELYDLEHPAAQVLVLTTTRGPDLTLQACLDSIEELMLLSHESV